MKYEYMKETLELRLTQFYFIQLEKKDIKDISEMESQLGYMT